jgi:hypothetical protein
VSAAGGPGASLLRAGRWLSRTLVDPPLPLVAVEVRPRAVAAVRLSREGGGLSLGAAATVEVPEGALEVSLARPNVTDPEALRGALRSALERAGALSGGDVSLVLPDPAVRLALLPAEGLKGRRGETEEVLRFRLHKALPSDFDARKARLAWQPAGPDQVLVAVAAEDVVRGYEEELEALGFRVGLVECAGLALAALEGTGAAGDGLLVNWDHGYVSFLVRRGTRPLLLRTLPREDSPESVARQAAQTLRFCREQLGGDGFSEVLVRSAAVPGPEAGEVLGRSLGTTPRLVRPWAAVGVLEDGEAAQAVAGAAACVLRRAA